MSFEEGIAQISDVVAATLVECVPVPDVQADIVMPVSPDASPVAEAMHATLEQTGAGPPPRER